tara:strand:- start:5366 stop:5983 length:618 start_codon:yes stop_codon:yes gene_type:complete
MQIIEHRINSIEKLKKIPFNHGVEIDVRYHDDKLILHHDPFSHHREKIEYLEPFLEAYSLSGPLILNIKTEGIEQACIDLMQKHKIVNWFFLDLSMPYFIKYARAAKANQIDGFGPDNLATRFSEFEPIEYALSFKGMANWLWVDYFTKYPVSDSKLSLLTTHFKLCLVSPELQGHTESTVRKLKKSTQSQPISAVCTKYPSLWK